MARQLNLIKQIPVSSPQAAGLAAMTLLLCAFALFMCASHSRKWRCTGACFGSSSHDPVIQLDTANIMQTSDPFMLSGELQQQGVAVWQRNILMGGKCRLPDFSGVIIYDSDGNVTPARNPRPLLLTWK